MKFSLDCFTFDAGAIASSDYSVFLSGSDDQHGFVPISFAPMCTDPHKRPLMAMHEYLMSYLDALHTLAGQAMYDYQDIKMDDSRAHKFSESSISLPGIYLACHIVELILKYVLSVKFNVVTSNDHDLRVLWELVEDKLVCALDENDDSGRRIVYDLRKFVMKLNEFSNSNNTRFRYAVDPGNNLSQQDMLFVDLCLLSRSVDLFVNQLLSLDEIPFCAPSLSWRTKLAMWSGSFSERWSFGSRYGGDFLGCYLFSALHNIPDLVVSKSQILFDHRQSPIFYGAEFKDIHDVTPKYVRDLYSHGPSFTWAALGTYRKIDFQFMGTVHSAEISVGYANNKSVGLSRLMQSMYMYICDTYKYQKDEPIYKFLQGCKEEGKNNDPN